ncbi:acyl-CoA dehydrogenase family protein [Actinomadura sp. 9N215]|uniref:acyl-CoA dehydrogenase family protein n=1 Tax=Actinomadura sp. 9N215 TaxID=3375150 RepID=UPI00378B3A12
MADRPALDKAVALVGELVGDRAGGWDAAGHVPGEVLRGLGAAGVLCAEVPGRSGGIGLSSRENGELTAYAGTLCGSVRSVMTSQGMAAWIVQRLADPGQRDALLPELTGGRLAAVGFSEPGAGSDLAAMTTGIRADGDSVVVDGRKVWVTGACYADLLVVFGRYEGERHQQGEGAAVLVPATAPGVTVERVPDPLGCRAAGHANVRLDGVAVPAANVLGGGGRSLALLVTVALAYGRISVAWGCVGILRACLRAAAEHAATREQFGRRLADHQLVARHLADLLAAERIATGACERASDGWDAGSPDLVADTVLAKYVSAGHAARGAASAVQVLASAGAHDQHVVARAYRDAKLMEIIEGSSEICQLILAERALDRPA